MSPHRPRLMIALQWYYPIGGIETFVSQLAPGLSDSFEITILLKRYGQLAVLPFSPNLKIVELKIGSTSEINKVLDQHKPEIVHINNLIPTFVRLEWLAKRRGAKTAWTLHQVPSNNIGALGSIIEPLVWRIFAFVSHRTDAVIAPSYYIQTLAKHHGLNSQVISCGVDQGRFKPGNMQEARRKLGLVEKPTVLFVGRFGREKNLLRLIQAVDQISKTEPVQLVLVGFSAILGNDDRQLASSLALLQKRGLLITPGFIPHDSPLLSYYYQAADVFALPSLFETQSIVTLEALASGVPVLASNRGALPEQVHSGQNGEICNPLDTNDIKQKLERLLKKRNEYNAELTRNHELKEVVVSYAALYLRLLA